MLQYKKKLEETLEKVKRERGNQLQCVDTPIEKDFRRYLRKQGMSRKDARQAKYLKSDYNCYEYVYIPRKNKIWLIIGVVITAIFLYLVIGGLYIACVQKIAGREYIFAMNIGAFSMFGVGAGIFIFACNINRKWKNIYLTSLPQEQWTQALTINRAIKTFQDEFRTKIESDKLENELRIISPECFDRVANKGAICGNCGSTLDKGARFCAKCGLKIGQTIDYKINNVFISNERIRDDI